MGDHVAGGQLAGRHHRQRAVTVGFGQVLGVGRHQQVQAQVAVGAARADEVRAGCLAVEEAQVRDYRSTLLAEPGLVHAHHADAVEKRRGGQHLTDRDHPGAAHPCHEHREPVGTGHRPFRLRDVGGRRARSGSPPARGDRRAGPSAGSGGVRPGLDPDERRAVALDARVVEVARGLVNAGLGPQLRVDGLNRQAVALGSAVAAALAHGLVDEDALGRGGAQAPLAFASLLGRALLVVDQHRHAGRVPQGDLGLVEAVPPPDVGALGQGTAVGVAVGIVAAHDDAAHALGGHRLGQLGHADGAGHVLAAGHGDGPVVEDLVGDVDASGHRSPHRQAGGVEERSVADVLEDVGPVGERRPADPGGALAAHLVNDLGPVVDPQGHGVAPHAGAHERALGSLRRAVVGAAAAPVRRSGHLCFAGPGGGLDQPQAGLHRHRQGAHLAAQHSGAEPVGDDDRDPVGAQLTVGGHQPAAALVGLAHHPGSTGPAVEDVPDEEFDEGPLLVQDQDLVEPSGEAAHDLGLERPHHAQAQQPDPEMAQSLIVEAEIAEGLAHLLERAARGHDPQAGRPGGPADLVEAVGCGIGGRRFQAPVGDVLLLLQAQRRHQAGPLDVAPRHAVNLQSGVDGHYPVGGHLGHAEPVGDGGDDLERGPQARVPRQGDAVQPEVDDLLHGAGVQDGDLGVVEGGLHLGGQRRRLGHRVVAGQHQHPAVGGGALEVGVLEHVAAAVHARPLAVPHAHDPVVAGERAEQRLLAAPHRGGGQLLVDARHPHHVVVGQQVHVALDGEVDGAQRRSLVAGDERGRAQAPGRVGAVLVDWKPDQRLDPGDQHPSPFQRELLIKIEVLVAGRRI